MERDTEKAYITYDREEVTRERLTETIISEIEEYTGEKPTVLNEQAGEDEIVLLIPDGTLAEIVEIRGVIKARSESVI